MGTTRLPTLLLLLLLGAAGCARTVVEFPLVTTPARGGPEADLEFWSALQSQPTVSNDEGLHALLLFEDEFDRARSYEARVEKAKTRGWLPDTWDEPASLAMQRGVVARAASKIGEIRGGVMMQIFGPSPRYATRELVSMGVMPPGTAQQTLSGAELLGVLGRLQDWSTLRALERTK